MTSLYGKRLSRIVLSIGLLLSVFSGVRLAAQSVSSVVFLPQTYFVGDRVEARIVLRDITADSVVVPETLPDTLWITFESITPVQRADGVELRILFQPFFVGTRELPPIDLGVTLLTGVSAFVTRVNPVGEDVRISSTRDQLVLPGTRIQLALGIVFLIGAPAIVFIAGGWGRRTVTRVQTWYRERRPYRYFLRAMKTIVAEKHGIDGRTFYIRLLDACRDYVAGRFDINARAATTGELDQVLAAAGITGENRDRIVELFQFGDLVKFAGRRVSIEEREQHIDQLRKIVEEMQKTGRTAGDRESVNVDS